MLSYKTIAGLVIIGILSLQIYSLKSENRELNEKYSILSVKYNTEKENNEKLMSAIEESNKKIKLYEEQSKDMKLKIESVNKIITESNTIKEEYEEMKTSSKNNNSSQEKEALQWLLNKALE